MIVSRLKGIGGLVVYPADMGGDRLQETALHEVWRGADAIRAPIEDGGGARYRILYSGISGGSFGPDFRNAVMEAPDGSEIVGDVEIHVEPRDWYAHGHHIDARYDNVILHAVGNVADSSPTINSIGLEVPQASIGIAGRWSGKNIQRAGGRSPEGDWSGDAGDEWFGMKVRMFQWEVSRYGADLALQMAVFECLGYPRNKEQFRCLAQRLPWPYLIRFGQRPRGYAEAPCDPNGPIQELVAWAAGFAEKPGWAGIPRLPGEAPRWVMAAGRPANHPRTRVGAATFLIEEWLRCGGPFTHATQAVRRSSKGSHVDEFFRSAEAGLGADRAGEIVVNAVLPLIAAVSISRRDAEMFRRVRRLFATHPGLHRNSVLREAERMLRQRGVLSTSAKGARAQLGVIHAYKRMILRPRPERQLPMGSFVPSV